MLSIAHDDLTIQFLYKKAKLIASGLVTFLTSPIPKLGLEKDILLIKLCPRLPVFQ